LEASALTTASQRGLLARRSPLLKLQGDERLIAMARNGNPGAFETLVDRYQGRLLGFCRQMLGSTEDAEDVLQEVFVNAYRAMLADEREINLRPWLYRIARNRCLNHLRKPRADAQESMDMVPAVEASSTAERVHNREEFRQLLTDVNRLPETQRSALLLREMDALSYEEIAQAMDTSVPSVKSLLVRARISLAEASQARLLTCGDVRLELAEAAEGLRKVSGPVRRHVRDCDECADFRAQVRTNEKALAALFPVGGLLALKSFIVAKLGLGGAGGGAGAGAAGGAGATGGVAGAGAAGAGAVSSAAGAAGAALSTSAAAGGLSAVGGTLGTKAVAGVVTAAVITAGAVEVKQQVVPEQGTQSAQVSRVHHQPTEAVAPTTVPLPAPAPVEPVAVPAVEEPTGAPVDTAADEDAAGGSTVPEDDAGTDAIAALPGRKVSETRAPARGHPAEEETQTIVITVGGTPAESPPSSSPPPPAGSGSSGSGSSSPPPESSSPPASGSGSGTATAGEGEASGDDESSPASADPQPE
jgi:RNA polymerase sigma factor (sigma-70 family)